MSSRGRATGNNFDQDFAWEQDNYAGANGVGGGAGTNGSAVGTQQHGVVQGGAYQTGSAGMHDVVGRPTTTMDMNNGTNKSGGAGGGANKNDPGVQKKLDYEMTELEPGVPYTGTPAPAPAASPGAVNGTTAPLAAPHTASPDGRSAPGVVAGRPVETSNGHGNTNANAQASPLPGQSNADIMDRGPPAPAPPPAPPVVDTNPFDPADDNSSGGSGRGSPQAPQASE